jgi:hypothetical protein
MHERYRVEILLGALKERSDAATFEGGESCILREALHWV